MTQYLYSKITIYEYYMIVDIIVILKCLLIITEYLINIQKDIQKLYVAYIKNILITKILNI